MPLPEESARHAQRRQRTLDLARRRRDAHLHTHIDETTGLASVDCVCQLADTYFSKRSAFGCGCRKTRKGRPRISGGMCKIGMRDRIYDWRREVRELREAVRSGRWEDTDPDRRYASAKHKAKRTFIVVRQNLLLTDSKASVASLLSALSRGSGWVVFRKYRTEVGRNAALAQFTKNGFSWGELRASGA